MEYDEIKQEAIEYVQIRSTFVKDSPSSNFQISTDVRGGRTVIAQSLHNSGCTHVCINAKKLNVEVRENINIVVTDTSNRPLACSGTCFLWLSCACQKHMTQRKYLRKVLFIEDLADQLIVPFEDLVHMCWVTFVVYPTQHV